MAGQAQRKPKTETGSDPYRVLIVDDSAVARAVITRALTSQDRYEVVGAAASADAALAFLNDHQVDAILLDIELPGVDGLTALPDLLAAGRGAKVLIVSSSCKDGAVATIQALTLGAADTLVKPAVGQLAGEFSRQLDSKLWRLLEGADDGHFAAARDMSVSAPLAPHARDFDIVAIGASTGGIHALSQLLRALPGTFRLPILVTQHLPESFMPYFAAQLAVLAGRPCDVAADNMPVREGRVFLAPGDAHLKIMTSNDGHIIRLNREPAVSGCLPSVDPMFESVAAAFGSRALAVVLSGMGRDGTAGAERIATAGGQTIVQDKRSSVVWGMPGSVASSGHAHAVLPPDQIGRVVARQRRVPC